ncbi:SMP-30/gluconolactonase/LRE family protein [Bradyrhizobium japonicum]|uniref:SMP-30/gluconolactonase/LRE family protein n=1 Tax=Bradyrhizobium japonicum TaxID=375 RepID=UPI001BA96E07|nr:SMP-30/gluconolactonase/LRE family protein [Bradyrhizobium japonicum]MBR0911563.1 SMP-30/gluconolactonase/LRE family protein [Bradyrhizobium japonicum]
MDDLCDGCGSSIVPDGICLDREGAIWVASPNSREVLHLREGGEVLERVGTAQMAIACMLGRTDRKSSSFPRLTALPRNVAARAIQHGSWQSKWTYPKQLALARFQEKFGNMHSFTDIAQIMAPVRAILQVAIETSTLESSVPFQWGIDFRSRFTSIAQQKFFDEAAQFGIRFGFTVPVASRCEQISIKAK